MISIPKQWFQNFGLSNFFLSPTEVSLLNLIQRGGRRLSAVDSFECEAWEEVSVGILMT